VTRLVAIDRRSYDTWHMRLILTLVFLASAAFLPGQADAFDRVQQAGQTLQISQSNGMSLSEAIESVRKRTGGKVVSAETRVQGGREVHHIKVLTKDGKVKTHKVNGRRR
jgi:uncharacterized membrane protein YkoI